MAASGLPFGQPRRARRQAMTAASGRTGRMTRAGSTSVAASAGPKPMHAARQPGRGLAIGHGCRLGRLRSYVSCCEPDDPMLDCRAVSVLLAVGAIACLLPGGALQPWTDGAASRPSSRARNESTSRRRA